jgi:hypothetical protein
MCIFCLQRNSNSRRTVRVRFFNYTCRYNFLHFKDYAPIVPCMLDHLVLVHQVGPKIAVFDVLAKSPATDFTMAQSFGTPLVVLLW